MKERKTPVYLEALVNLSRERNAWKHIAYLLGSVCVFLSVSMVWLRADAPAYIVPYELALAGEEVSVAPRSVIDPKYLTYLAEADIQLLTNWTPETIGLQYQRFLNRATRELRAQQEIELIKEATKLTKGIAIQSFYIKKTEVLDQTTVRLTGELVRWEGEKLAFRTPIKYLVEYAIENGYAEVNTVTVEGKQNEKQ